LLYDASAALSGATIFAYRPAHLLGTFVSRTSWGLVLLGAILAFGVAGSMAAIYDVSTGRATIPGLLLWFNVIPFFKWGSEFQVHPDGSVSVRTKNSWEPLMGHQYSSTVTADRTTIDVTPPSDGLPAQQCQRRVRPPSSGGPGSHDRGSGFQKQLSRKLKMTADRSGRLDSCSW